MTQPKFKDFGELLKGGREVHNLTEREVSIMVGSTRARVAHWCQGRALPNGMELEKLKRIMPGIKSYVTKNAHLFMSVEELKDFAEFNAGAVLPPVEEVVKSPPPMTEWELACAEARRKHQALPPKPVVHTVPTSVLKTPPKRSHKRKTPPPHVPGPFEQALADGLMEGIITGLRGWKDMKPFANLR